MPRYHVLSRHKRCKKGEFKSEGIVHGLHGVKSAFSSYKKYLNSVCKKLDNDREYFFYQINHARFFQCKNGKFEINSFYGNHETKETKSKKVAEKRRQKVRDNLNTIIQSGKNK